MDLIAQQLNIDTEIAKLTPALYTVVAFMSLVFAALCAIVWKLTRDNKESRETFLGHISNSADRQIRIETERSESLEKLGNNCHSFQKELSLETWQIFRDVSQALSQNTTELGSNSEMLRGMSALLEEKRKLLEKMTEKIEKKL